MNARRIVVLVLFLMLARTASGQQASLVAHEWGTLTSIAGNDGTAVEWYPWAVPSDLPRFVEHWQPGNFKASLSGTIRMETPVLYFYAAQETSVSVQVTFSKGLITEWYPHATRSAPSDKNLTSVALPGNDTGGGVTWSGITLRPAAESSPPQEQNKSRYYAARITNSSPLLVRTATGTQTEKFLFYRGVSSEQSPVTAKVLADGNVEVLDLIDEPVAKLFWFERRGSTIGIRTTTQLEERAVIAPPGLSASVEMAESEVLSALMDQALYPDEARAMIETWKDSWFEEGSRLLYIVPKSFVNRVLPLTISPTPGETTRVFVGRLELVTPKTRSAIETALALGDERALAKYNRFLQPIMEILLQRESDPFKVKMIQRRLSRPYAPLAVEEVAANRTRN